jgi:hypothetical protein
MHGCGVDTYAGRRGRTVTDGEQHLSVDLPAAKTIGFRT